MQVRLFLSQPADSQGGSGFSSGRCSVCPVQQINFGPNESFSVPESVNVIVEADQGARGSTVCMTAFPAAAVLNPHNVIEALSVRTVEAKPHCTGDGGDTATTISASPTGARAIPLRCRASSKGNSNWSLWTDGSQTLPSLKDARETTTFKVLYYMNTLIQYMFQTKLNSYQ